MLEDIAVMEYFQVEGFHDLADGVIPSPLSVVPPKKIRLDSNPNVGTFVSRGKEHVRK
jgi:hypothetical protein